MEEIEEMEEIEDMKEMKEMEKMEDMEDMEDIEEMEEVEEMEKKVVELSVNPILDWTFDHLSRLCPLFKEESNSPETINILSKFTGLSEDIFIDPSLHLTIKEHVILLLQKKLNTLDPEGETIYFQLGFNERFLKWVQVEFYFHLTIEEIIEVMIEKTFSYLFESYQIKKDKRNFPQQFSKFPLETLVVHKRINISLVPTANLSQTSDKIQAIKTYLINFLSEHNLSSSWYHGTNWEGGINILDNRIDLTFGTPKKDFGNNSFYCGNDLEFAINWSLNVRGPQSCLLFFDANEWIYEPSQQPIKNLKENIPDWKEVIKVCRKGYNHLIKDYKIIIGPMFDCKNIKIPAPITHPNQTISLQFAVKEQETADSLYQKLVLVVFFQSS